jgi:hypothetical protein
MKRIDSAGAANGKWVDKDPATGRPGTTLQAAWLNSLQEEVCTVIEKAGLKLDAASTTQLYDGIQTLIQNRRRDPTKIPTVQNGFFAFPRTRGLVEFGGIVNTDSALTRVSAGIYLEDELDPTTAGGRFLTNWCFVLNDGVLPSPLKANQLVSRLRHTLGTDFVDAEIYTIGTAVVCRGFAEGETPPAATPIISTAQCLFGRIIAGTAAGITPGSLTGKYCLLFHMLENANTQVVDSILVDFSYYS